MAVVFHKTAESLCTVASTVLVFASLGLSQRFVVEDYRTLTFPCIAQEDQALEDPMTCKHLFFSVEPEYQTVVAWQQHPTKPYQVLLLLRLLGCTFPRQVPLVCEL